MDLNQAALWMVITRLIDIRILYDCRKVCRWFYNAYLERIRDPSQRRELLNHPKIASVVIQMIRADLRPCWPIDIKPSYLRNWIIRLPERFPTYLKSSWLQSRVRMPNLVNQTLPDKHPITIYQRYMVLLTELTEIVNNHERHT